MTSQVLRTLEEKGFITRAVDPADTRARRLAVSGRGAELAGILGALAAIPVAGAIQVIIRDQLAHRRGLITPATAAEPE